MCTFVNVVIKSKQINADLWVFLMYSRIHHIRSRGRILLCVYRLYIMAYVVFSSHLIRLYVCLLQILEPENHYNTVLITQNNVTVK